MKDKYTVNWNNQTFNPISILSIFDMWFSVGHYLVSKYKGKRTEVSGHLFKSEGSCLARN